MSRSPRSHDTLVYRLSQVLTKLNMDESLDPQVLADEFRVNLRTIRRDLNVRVVCLPLVKAGGRYRMDESHLGKLTIKVKPGTTGRDWTAPIWETKNGETYQVSPGTTSRDWTAPSFRTDKK